MNKKEKEIIELEDLATATENELSTDVKSAKPVKMKYKKKKSKGKIVAIVIVILLAALIVYNMISSALAGPPATLVQVQPVVMGNVKQTLNTSGTITTAEKVTLYSLVSAPLNKVDIELGSKVTNGQELFMYDTADLDKAYRQAAANSSLSSLQEQASKNSNNDSKQLVSDYQESIGNLEYQKGVAQSRLDEAQAALNKLQEELGPQMIADQAELDALKAVNSTDLARIQELEQKLAQAQAQLDAARAAVTVNQQDVAAQQSMLTQVNGLQDNAEKSLQTTDNALKQSQVSQVPVSIALQTAKENLALGQAGVVAPMNGVVTSLTAAEGSMATQYGVLCTIESLDKVDVVVQLSKYDLERVQVGQSAVITSLEKEYTGTVTKIDSMATKQTTTTGSTSFVNATISINNPDSSIVLGLEATVDILTAEVDNTLTIPLSAVNTDVDGTYCFVVENGVAVRRAITTGISSDSVAQVTEGLQEGDQVILSSQNIVEGSPVQIGDADTMQAANAAGITFGMG